MIVRPDHHHHTGECGDQHNDGEGKSYSCQCDWSNFGDMPNVHSVNNVIKNIDQLGNYRRNCKASHKTGQGHCAKFLFFCLFHGIPLF